jgi:hypothetical protein
MVEHRPNNKPPAAPANKAPPEANAAPAALSVEERGVAALTGDALSSATLATLIEETNSAIGAAERVAAAEKEKAFDLALSHADARAAHDRMVDASFRCDRWKTLAPRLQQRFAETVVREEAAAWISERDAFEAEHLPAMAEQRHRYDTAVQTVISFFAQVTAFSAARGALLSRRPTHLGLQNIDDPAPAPSLLQNSRLFDLAGKQLRPDPAQVNKLAVEMASSVALMAGGDPEQFSPFWWRAAQRRAARVEAERNDARLRQMAADQEKRVNEEEAARWNAAHGTR